MYVGMGTDAHPCMQVELPKKAKIATGPGGGSEPKYPFDFDRVVKAMSPLANKEMYGALVLPVLERFCQG